MPADIAHQDDEGTVRAYGVLATILSGALDDAHRALESHADLLADRRLGEFDSLRAEFARRRVRVAIYGEVKAGKSTLLNALAGTELSPMAFDPLTSIPVRVTHGQRSGWRLGDRTFDRIGELAAAMRHGVGDAGEVVVETDLDLLRLGGQLDLLDTPGIGAEERLDALSAEVLRSLDAVVLVVRYPALYTRFTQKLVDELQADIGKLFLVWNLDTACAELPPAELARHAETLREKVAGAHDLYLVNARDGSAASQAQDPEAIAASGLAAFGDGLSRFASSEKREVAALREAAKRADQWFGDAQAALTNRQAELATMLDDARSRLEAVQRAADAKASAARVRMGEFQVALARVGKERQTIATGHATRLTRQLRAGRWRWVREGDVDRLNDAVATATGAYADAVEQASQVTAEKLSAIAEEFGAGITTAPRQRVEPVVEALGPAGRGDRGRSGYARWVRRALWRKWYLPGLAAFERTAMGDELAAQASWFDAAARAADTAARAVLESRLAETARDAQEEIERIKVETNFTRNEAEHEGLGRHAPIVRARRAIVARIKQEARLLIA